MFFLPGRGQPIASKVFRPKMTGCPIVISRNLFWSDGIFQGMELPRPITRFSAMAAMSEMIMDAPDSYLSKGPARCQCTEHAGPYRFLSFRLKGYNRVELGCFFCRVDAEEQTGGGREKEGDDHGRNGDARRQFGGPAHDEGGKDTQHCADHAAGDAQHECLHEELEHDIFTPGPKRAAESDLLDTLLDGNEHDREDAHPADEERHRGDAPQEHGERFGRLLLRAQDVHLVLDAEILFLAGLYMVALAQKGGNVIRRPVHDRTVFCLDIDVVHVRDVHEPAHYRGDGYNDLIVVILTDGVHTLLLDDADDLEGNIIDPYQFADRVVSFKEVMHHRPSQDGNAHRSLYLVVGEEATRRRPEIPYLGEVGSCPGYDGACARVSVFDHEFFALKGGRLADEGGFIGDNLGVAHRERDDISDLPGPAGDDAHLARCHDDEVCAQTPDLFEHRCLRPPADRHHEDHCGHADHNADHGQGSAHLVRTEGLEGDLCAFDELHKTM